MTPAPSAHLSIFAMAAPPTADITAATCGSLRAEIVQLISRVQSFLRRQGYVSADENCALAARVTPFDDQGRPGQTRQVRVNKLNERGIAFDHRLPLQDRRAIVSLDDPEFGDLTAEIDLSWCRYQSGGKYTSGGRFVKMHKRPA